MTYRFGDLAFTPHVREVQEELGSRRHYARLEAGEPTTVVLGPDERTIGFADFRGNRQYVSVGNLRSNDRVALILVDYPTRQRLKLLGRARLVDADSDEAARLGNEGYGARVERGFVIAVEAFDWNCPQHITPRFTEADVERVVAPLKARIAELERAASGAQGKR